MTGENFPGDALLAADVLASRPAAFRDAGRESAALDRLVAGICKQPQMALQALVETALNLCEAGSAGVSLLDHDHFYWPAIAGAWSQHAGGEIPMDAAPCGVVIKHDRPFLLDEPGKLFRYEDSEPPIHEVLLVPLHFGCRPQGTLWLLSHNDHRFDAEDVRILQRLALFATSIEEAGRQRKDTRALSALRQRVRNALSVIREIVRHAGEQAEEEQDAKRIVAELGSRISTYADAARLAVPAQSTDLRLLILDVSRRFGEREGGRIALDGPDVSIAPDEAGPLALAFHELLDNALRHGSLVPRSGRVEVTWRVEERGTASHLLLQWKEEGMSELAARSPPGFGFNILEVGLPETLRARTSIEAAGRSFQFLLEFPLTRQAS